MELLFRREQTTGKLARVNFKLWGKIEFDEDEQAIVKRYRFDEAVLIEAIQPDLFRKVIYVAIGVFAVVVLLLGSLIGITAAMVLGVLAGGGAGYWYLNEKRETIFVKDLIHGRHFTCDSVVELARKEAWLETITAFLRHVMESAKHWDGTARHSIEALPKDEARHVR